MAFTRVRRAQETDINESYQPESNCANHNKILNRAPPVEVTASRGTRFELCDLWRTQVDCVLRFRGQRQAVS